MARIALLAATAILAPLFGQQHDFTGVINKEPERAALAVPDFRATTDTSNFLGAFNEVLWADLEDGGNFRMVPKTLYPSPSPQQISDFRDQTSSPPGLGNPISSSPPVTGYGYSLRNWSLPPVQASHLAIGYAVVQDRLLVVRCSFLDTRQDTLTGAQLLAKVYIESPDEAGARAAAHKFASDILAIFGLTSVYGSHIYFVREARPSPNRATEIWMMDSDGKNQRQITHYDSLSIEPALAPDGAKLAFVSYARGNPGIFLFSVNPIRDLRFYNQQGAGLSGQPSFAPDGRQIVFMSSVGGCCNIFSANLDGSGLRRITTSATINAEPKINPKNSDELAFVSGRSGPQQLYRMDIDGGGIERLTDGTGQASNPSWNPSGQTLAFAWTRGFEPGHWNIFLMDVASRRYQQLTHEEGRNENPSWGPDGAHLVFMSTRSGTPQIWTMLADGTHLKQLTTHGQNFSPVWGK